MSSIVQDFRYGLRGLRNQIGFAVAASLALALGIGAATTIFSVIQNVLLDPFPYAHADKIFVVQIRDLTTGPRGWRSGFQVPEFLDYQSLVTAFDEVIADAQDDVLYEAPEGTERISGAIVSGNTFRFLGVNAAVGRVLTPNDAKPETPPVFVISHRMWAKQFGLDSAVLGKSFVLSGVPTTLVGIMPPRFAHLAADLWRPVTLDRADPAGNQRFYTLRAHLKPGVAVTQAEVELQVVANRLARVYPKIYPKQFVVKAVSWIDSVVGPFRTTLYTLAAAVGLLLLIACGNVANLLLARAQAREKEMAIRASLGASRPRLVRQLLIESSLLAVLGAGAGSLCALFGLEALVKAIPDHLIPPEAAIRVNLPVLLFSLAMAALTALVFGLVPALQTATRDVADHLRDSGKGVGGARRRGRLSGALVVAEVALSLVLLAGAGLLMRSFVNLRATELGLNPENVLVVAVRLPDDRYRTAVAQQQLMSQLLPDLNALPSVVVAAVASAVPAYGGLRSEIEIPGKGRIEAPSPVLVQLCSEDLFRTLGLRLLRGRLLSPNEVKQARKLTVVNETLARWYFGQEDPIGKTMISRFQARWDGGVDTLRFEIVGVVADAKNHGIRDPALPEAFVPYSVTGASDRFLLIKTAGAPLPLLGSVRRAIQAVDRNLVVVESGSLTDYLREYSYAEPSFSLAVLGVFAGAGLVLVVLGVYGVVAYTVSRQTREIGIRMALGATRGDVQGMVLRMALRLIGSGVVTGLLATLAVTRVLASQLWGVKPHDPLTLGVVVALMVAAGVAACFLPARHASRVDPIVAMRCE